MKFKKTNLPSMGSNTDAEG